MSDEEQFHRGERAIQTRLGVRDALARTGQRAIRDHLIDQHRAFYEQIPSLYYSALDSSGRPWASMLSGAPGFTRTPTDKRLEIDAAPLSGDPVFDELATGDPVGLLGLVHATRRRNRANGIVAERSETSLTVNIVQSFGNCPKYIQHRTVEDSVQTVAASVVSETAQFSETQQAIIQRADTFYIATYAANEDGDHRGGMDMSHRGGRPGFVHLLSDTDLVWPDFSGNNFFNTLGNLAINPLAGLLFLDYQNGSALYLTGSTQILWEDESVTGFEGAERMVRFTLDSAVLATNALQERWSVAESSPFLDHTGNWAAALGQNAE